MHTYCNQILPFPWYIRQKPSVNVIILLLLSLQLEVIVTCRGHFSIKNRFVFPHRILQGDEEVVLVLMRHLLLFEFATKWQNKRRGGGGREKLRKSITSKDHQAGNL